MSISVKNRVVAAGVGVLAAAALVLGGGSAAFASNNSRQWTWTCSSGSHYLPVKVQSVTGYSASAGIVFYLAGTSSKVYASAQHDYPSSSGGWHAFAHSTYKPGTSLDGTAWITSSFGGTLSTPQGNPGPGCAS